MGSSLPSCCVSAFALLALMLAGLISAGEALALRPFLAATDADLVAQGSIELETGASLRRRVGGEQGRLSFGATNFAFNAGVSDHLQITLTAGPDIFFSDLQHGPQPGLNVLSEAALTAKVRLVEADGVRPALATEWTISLPAEAESGSQLPGVVGIVAASAKLGPLIFHLNLGGAVEPRQGESKGVSSAFLWTASGQVPLTDRVDLVGEVRGRLDQSSLPNHTALMGLVWEASRGIKVDLGAFIGLSRGADDWGIVAGLTYELSAFPWGAVGWL